MADSIAKLEKAFRRDPDSPRFARLADLHLKRGRIERALELCQKGCASFPDYATGFIVLSKCYEQRGALEEAREAMGQALRLDPENPGGYKCLAHLFEQLGVTTLALQSLRQAAYLDPFDPYLAERIDHFTRRIHQTAPEPEEVAASTDSEAQAAYLDSFDAAPAAQIDPLGDQTHQAAPEPEGSNRFADASPNSHQAAPEPEESVASAAPKDRGVEATQPQPTEDRDDLYGDTDDSELLRLLQEIEEEEAAEPVPAPAEPPTPPASEPSTPKSKRIATMTLAEIYTTQGLTQKAIETYRELLEQEPTNTIIRSKLASLEQSSSAH